MLCLAAIVVFTYGCISCSKKIELHHPSLPDEPFREFTLGYQLIDGFSALRTFRFGYHDKKPILWGVIDEKNKIVVQPSYESITALPPYFVAKADIGYWLLRQDGSKVFEEPYAHFEAPTEGFGRVYNYKGQVAFFNDNGEILGGHWFNDSARKIRAMQDGMAWNRDRHFLRTDGQLIQTPDMVRHTLREIKHGFGVAGTTTCCAYTGVTFFNKDLIPATTKRWLDAKNFNGNYGQAESAHGWDLIDQRMEEHPLGPFKKITTYDQGFYHVVRKNNTHNIINDNGELLLSEWQEELTAMVNGMAIIKKGDKYNIINAQGKKISTEWYDDINFEEGGFVSVWKSGKGYNYMDKDGGLINKDWFIYRKPVIKDRRSSLRLIATGITNKRGSDRTAINEQYELIEGEPFSNLKAINRLMKTDFVQGNYSDHQHQILDLDGKLLYQEAFNNVSTLSSSSFLVVKRADSKANLIDSFSSKGKLISEHWYDKVFSPRFGQKCALVRDNDKGNFMYTDGSLLSKQWGDQAYSTFTSGKQDMRTIKLNGEYIVMNENCDLITEERYPKLISEFGHAHFCITKSRFPSTDWYKLLYSGETELVGSEDNCFKNKE